MIRIRKQLPDFSFFLYKIGFTQAVAVSANSQANTPPTSNETVNAATPISEKSELKDLNDTVITHVIEKTMVPNDKAKVIKSKC